MSATEVNIDMASPIAQQGANANKSYTFDLVSLLPDGDPLAAVAWTVPVQLTKTGESFNATTCTVTLSGGVASTWYAVTATYVTVSGNQDQFTLRLFIEPSAASLSSLGTALFPNRFTAVNSLRTDRLLVAAGGILPKIAVSDDYLWDKIRAAEAETSRDLRVFFQPTTLFPDTPTSAEITALNGAPWAIDPGYDFGPENFYEGKWGMINTRQRPIVSVSSIRMVYPSPGAVNMDFPADWIRLDRKYGQIRLVPNSTLSLTSLSASIMQLFSSRMLPQALEVRYVAGLSNAAQDYPDLINVVLKRAVLLIIGDRFQPQSGSISADGLSQSFSVDMEKYHDWVNTALFGPKGSNGGLQTAIHGIRMGTLGV